MDGWILIARACGGATEGKKAWEGRKDGRGGVGRERDVFMYLRYHEIGIFIAGGAVIVLSVAGGGLKGENI